MPAEQITAASHIDGARLLELAKSETTTITQGEFHHLQTCTACFKLWKEFLKDNDRADSGT